MKVALLFTLAAIGITLTSGTARAQLGDCPALGAALVDHTCFHTIFGPFESMQATAGTTISDATPHVNPVHTEFRVGLTGDVSTVTYRPARSGAWTVFLGSEAPFRVLDEEVGELSEIFSASGDVGCSGLAEAHVFELTADETYRFVLGPTSLPSVVVVIEYVEDFLIDNGRDADGDGYGSPDDTVRSACVPPAGYVQNTGDCNDDDPSLNPGVPEICDGIDQNCNGLADDVGLECRVGQGVCLAVGTLVCDGELGDPVRCDAEPGAPEPEICDGKDNDCDGGIDGVNDLCADAAEGPTCVRQDFAAFCGCALDQDCGPPDSGRICDAKERRCVDGCSAEPGRNGCPEDQECVEGEPGLHECMPEASAPGSDDGGDLEPLPGCGCRVGVSPHGGGAGPLAALLAGLLVWRRRVHAGRRAPGKGAWLAALLAAASTWACGGQVQDMDGSGGTPSGEECVPILGKKTVAHACSHTNRGPYVPVAASASSSPNVSVLHKTFSVLVEDEDGSLTYIPKRDGEHVVLTNHEVAIDVFEEGQSTALQGPPFPVEGCDTIAWARRVELVPQKTYTLRVGEAAGTKFDLFIEYPPAFGDDAWVEACP